VGLLVIISPIAAELRRALIVQQEGQERELQRTADPASSRLSRSQLGN